MAKPMVAPRTTVVAESMGRPRHIGTVASATQAAVRSEAVIRAVRRARIPPAVIPSVVEGRRSQVNH